MTKKSALNQLETIISKLSKLNYHIDGNQLQQAIREADYVRNKLQGGLLDIKKIK